jgi:hypothetical protein
MTTGVESIGGGPGHAIATPSSFRRWRMSATKFSRDQQYSVLIASGIGVGASFDYTFLDGTTATLEHSAPGVISVFSDDETLAPELGFLFLTIWELAIFGRQRGLCRFSEPMPPSEFMQAFELMKRLATDPVYADLTLDLVIPRIEEAFTDFWADFRPGAPCGSYLN